MEEDEERDRERGDGDAEDEQGPCISFTQKSAAILCPATPLKPAMINLGRGMAQKSAWSTTRAANTYPNLEQMRPNSGNTFSKSKTSSIQNCVRLASSKNNMNFPKIVAVPGCCSTAPVRAVLPDTCRCRENG